MRVRGGDHVSDAVGDGHFGHGAGDFHALGAVVQSRENMAMNVDHLLQIHAAVTSVQRGCKQRGASCNPGTGAPRARLWAPSELL